ncbi:MAG TPA: CPBP family intramembrane glutamic endopeptidase [Candidatus Saccharimonadales bacterium]|nr:CPBP family intramembrane glutamic endopeptidase [Candidatus Saccharimonadales bacterium]
MTLENEQASTITRERPDIRPPAKDDLPLVKAAVRGAAGHEPVASYRHSVVFLGIAALVVLLGYMAQHRQVEGGGLTESHANVIPIYLSATFMNWLLVWFVWRGTRRRGVGFLALIRGRWAGVRDVARDVGIALGCWGVLLAIVWALSWMVGQGGEKSLELLLPQTPGEVLAWLVTSASAGFCEELVFRGYVQRQLLALTQRGSLAVLGQGIVFGMMHAYQGWRPVLHICAIGIFLGVVAVWRKSLRVGMIVHGWQDVWAGWLSGMILR